MQFYGQSESHMRAETLQQLITKLDIGPCIIAGGSGGARDSMLTTMLYPELVTKLVVWNIVGGVYGSFVLGGHYIMPSILAVRGMRHQGSAARGRVEGAHRRESGRTATASCALDADEFLKVMLRWLNAFVSKPGQTIPGVPDEMFDNITVPTLIIRGGENDWDHPKRTSLEVSCLIKGSEADRSAVAGGRVGARGREVRRQWRKEVLPLRHVGAGGARRSSTSWSS